MKNQSPLRQFQAVGHVAFMAALIAAGAYFHMRLGQVPVTFQDMFAALAGLALGPRLAPLAVLLYLLAGAVGLPVFSGGTGGPGVLLGPTGGYLAGFVPLALCAGLGARLALKNPPAGSDLSLARLIPALLGCLAGMALLYVCGVARLMQVLECDLDKALVVGVWPFLPFAGVKLVCAVLLWRMLRRRGLTLQ